MTLDWAMLACDLPLACAQQVYLLGEKIARKLINFVVTWFRTTKLWFLVICVESLLCRKVPYKGWFSELCYMNPTYRGRWFQHPRKSQQPCKEVKL